MTSSTARRSMSLISWLLLTLLLLLAGAAAAVWALTRYDAAARFFGIVPVPVAQGPRLSLRSEPVRPGESRQAALPGEQLDDLALRVARLENATQRVAGSAGRADALLIAFAARRAIDRGVALGYLEPLLMDRFGATHRQAVATIITASRDPVRLDQLNAEFEGLAKTLQGGAPEESLWRGVQREFSTLVSIRRSDQPNPQPSATYRRAQARLGAGQVDLALAEVMRLPGVPRARPWVDRARTYVAVHRALDEIESAALMGGTR